MKDLNIALVQTRLDWEQPEANRRHIGEMLKHIPAGTHLVVLPEMFTTGFTMNPAQHAEQMAPRMLTLEWMRTLCAQGNFVLTGSVAVKENEQYFNRLLWVRPDGSYSFYDKRHLFSFGHEHLHYQRGESRLVEEINGWRICPLICYDLRFPVWSRNKLVDGRPLYDVLVYVANWPAVRSAPWQKLLPARAIENQCYVAAVNRVGTDASGQQHTGDSAIIDARGEYLGTLGSGEEGVLSATLQREPLDDFRARFPVLADADV